MKKFPYPQEIEDLATDVDAVLEEIEVGAGRGDFESPGLAVQMAQGLQQGLTLRKIQFLLEQLVWLQAGSEPEA